MDQVDIEKICVDDENRVRIYVGTTKYDDYQLIYRTASGVRWDQQGHYLYSEIPRKLSHADWFGLIDDAVRSEYGEALLITERTVWENVSQEVETEIRQRQASSRFN